MSITESVHREASSSRFFHGVRAGDRKGRPYERGRIATASVRTGFAMTSFAWGAVGRDDVGIVPYGRVVGADDPVRPMRCFLFRYIF